MKKRKNTPYIALYFSALILENARLSPVFLLDSNSPCLDLLFPQSHKPQKKKKTFRVSCTVLKQTQIKKGGNDFESADEMPKKSYNLVVQMKVSEEFLPTVLYYALERISSHL